MEYVSCNLCGADDGELAHSLVDRLHGLPGRFSLLRCRRCGLLYLSPRPEAGELAAYYPADYVSFAPAVGNEPSALVRLDRRFGLHRRLAALERARRGGRLLDVGCATGDFLAYARETGRWQVWGVEPAAEPARYCRERLGLEVFCGQVEEAGFPASFFDSVTFWDSLEHLPDPKRVLKEVHRVLKGDGLTLISLPNLDSFDARLFKGYWAGLDAPRHLYVFSGATLARMLEVAGLRLAGTRCFTGRYHSFALSVRFLLSGRRGLVERLALAAVGSGAFRALSYPYFALVDGLGRGATLTAYAVPQGGEAQAEEAT